MELTRLQKLLLAALAVMLVVFSGLMAFSRTHPGVEFEEGLLKVTENGDQTLYTGKAHGTPVTITAAKPGGALTEVDFTIGEAIHDVCRVEYPLDILRTERGALVRGIRVSRNGETLFTGGYDPESELGWYDTEGQWSPQIDMRFSGGGSDPWYGYETGLNQIVRFAFGVEANAAHGDPLLFAMAVLLSILAAISILFHKTLFRWRHWAARDPEPSEGYLAMERVWWVAWTVIIGVFYIGALVKIY